MAVDVRRYAAWLGRGLLALPLGFVLAGVPLAIAGAFQPLPVAIASCAGAAAVAVLWGRPDSRWRSIPRPPVALAVVLVAVTTVVNGQLSAQHVIVDRDPGVYTLTARWMSSQNSLLIDAPAPAFGDRTDLRYHGFGFYPDAPGGRIYAQFLHLFPAVLAVGDWIGGSWLLTKTNALVAGGALLMFFAFAARLLSPWPALGATAALGLSLPFTYFARDSYSELATLGLLMGGLWLLSIARAQVSARRGLVAGLVLGATCMTRIDSLIYLGPLLLYLAIELFSARHVGTSERRRIDSFAAAVAGGLAITAGLGLLDGALRSPGYLSDHRTELYGAAAAVAVGAGAAGLALALRRRLRVLRSNAGDSWRAASANVAAGGLLALSAFAYFVRPSVTEANDRSENWNTAHIISHQDAEGLPIDGSRTYAEDTMLWLDWYLGPVVLALGVVGAALLIRRVLRGGDRAALPFLLVFVATAALYVWQPNIYPDQPWAIRRFLPVVIPGLVLLCFWTLRLAWRRSGELRRGRVAARVAVIAGAALAIAVPALYGRDLAGQEGTQVPMAYEMDQFCAELDDRAAVAVQDDARNLAASFLQTVQIFCRVPVAAAPAGKDLAWYQDLEREVREEGRRLYLLSPTTTPFRPPPSGVSVAFDLTYAVVEQPLERRPERVDRLRFQTFMIPLSPGG